MRVWIEAEYDQTKAKDEDAVRELIQKLRDLGLDKVVVHTERQVTP